MSNERRREDYPPPFVILIRIRFWVTTLLGRDTNLLLSIILHCVLCSNIVFNKNMALLVKIRTLTDNNRFVAQPYLYHDRDISCLLVSFRV